MATPVSPSWARKDTPPATSVEMWVSRHANDLTKERGRALRLISGYTPPPTFIIDSGGGYQGFWLLRDEVPIDGSEEQAPSWSRITSRSRSSFKPTHATTSTALCGFRE